MSDNIKVVSFDIFDTLLIRPFIKPSDLFRYIEVSTKSDGFYNWRQGIERRLFLRYARQVTFDEIYSSAPHEYKYHKLIELETESRFLKPNADIVPLFNKYRDEGYRIIAISDMYLPSKFLHKVLDDNGFKGIEKVFVSNEYNATKFKGTLYKKVLSELEIKSSELLHIGDNSYSDIKIASRLGIETIHVQKRKGEVFKETKFIRKFYSSNKDLAHSIITSILVENSRREMSVEERFGFEVAGPMILSYTSFVYRIAKEKGFKKLLCIARDGYFVKACIDALSLDISAVYTYAPRIEYYLTHYDTDYQTDSTIPELVLNYFGIDTDDNKRHWIRKNKKRLLPLLESERKRLNYEAYISSLVNKERKVAIVDGPSGKRTSQKFIQKELGYDVFTFYIQVLPRRIYKMFKKTSILRFPKHYIINRVYRSSFIERVFTSPYRGVEFVYSDGSVEFKNETPSDKAREDAYKRVERGILAFMDKIKPFKDIIDIFGNEGVFEGMLYAYTTYNKQEVKKIKEILKEDSWFLYSPELTETNKSKLTEN